MNAFVKRQNVLSLLLLNMGKRFPRFSTTVTNENARQWVGKVLSFYPVFPLSTAECKRGFSKIDIIKTKLRNSLSAESLRYILLLEVNSGDLCRRSDCRSSRWMAWRNRKQAKWSAKVAAAVGRRQCWRYRRRQRKQRRFGYATGRRRWRNAFRQWLQWIKRNYFWCAIVKCVKMLFCRTYFCLTPVFTKRAFVCKNTFVAPDTWFIAKPDFSCQAIL